MPTTARLDSATRVLALNDGANPGAPRSRLTCFGIVYAEP